jgi:hypothetical protein
LGAFLCLAPQIYFSQLVVTRTLLRDMLHMRPYCEPLTRPRNAIALPVHIGPIAECPAYNALLAHAVTTGRVKAWIDAMRAGHGLHWFAHGNPLQSHFVPVDGFAKGFSLSDSAAIVCNSRSIRARLRSTASPALAGTLAGSSSDIQQVIRCCISFESKRSNFFVFGTQTPNVN